MQITSAKDTGLQVDCAELIRAHLEQPLLVNHRLDFFVFKFLYETGQSALA